MILSLLNLVFSLCFVLVLALIHVRACTNLLITPGASSDQSTIISYNADAASLYGMLYHYEKKLDIEEGTMRDVWDWDSGRYLGQIDESNETFNVIGNVNEHGLIIGETTYGGLSSLQTQSKAKIDYGSLIYITLQRAKTAREAIEILDDLMQKYGYASEGESFSIGDQNEVWIMEMIGKGEYELGSVWVAQKLPDGAVSGHANQARITTFDQNDYDSENVMFAPDVISFARQIGAYDGADEDFSFSDVYDPVTFDGARFCDARVWSFFSTLMGSDWSSQYEDYATGQNLTNRMPLYVIPPVSVPLETIFAGMRNHYEGTVLDMTSTQFPDVGAEDGYSPYRDHPLTWESKGQTYLNERPIGTQQTGWNFIAQSRSWMPRELAALMWFGVDDSSTTVRVPFYGSSKKAPNSFAGLGPQDGQPAPMMKFDTKSAFYVFNLVANWAYSKWSTIYPDVLSEIKRREHLYFQLVADMDKKSLEIYNTNGPEDAIDMVTTFSVDLGDTLVREWFEFFGNLFVRYRDGYKITEDKNSEACNCSPGNAPYPSAWYDRIASENPSHFQDGTSDAFELETQQHKPVSKKVLLQKK